LRAGSAPPAAAADYNEDRRTPPIRYERVQFCDRP
jgi:hypothetical protein